MRETLNNARNTEVMTRGEEGRVKEGKRSMTEERARQRGTTATQI